MLRKLAATAAITAFAVVGLAGHADAKSPKGACVQAGLGTLKSIGALQDAAQKQIDYSLLLPALPEGSFLSLGQVVKLHTSSPELFPWCSAS